MTAQLPPGIQVEKSEEDDRIMTLNVGPQHPGSGHMRLIVKIDGDFIVSCDPDPGYVHRGEEKMAEYRNYITNIPHLERPVIHDSCNILYPYCLAVEDLLGLEVPERAKYVRVIASELNRCVYIQYWLAIYGIFLGHSTMFMWPAGDRELLIDLLEKMTGARVTHSYFIPGGVRNDVPANFEDVCKRQVDYFEKRIKEYADIFYDNPILISRTKDTGILSRQDAIRLGTTGSQSDCNVRTNMCFVNWFAYNSSRIWPVMTTCKSIPCLARSFRSRAIVTTSLANVSSSHFRKAAPVAPRH